MFLKAFPIGDSLDRDGPAVARPAKQEGLVDLTITPLDATLGATITDIDLANMEEATWQCVKDAFHEYALLIYPGQDLSSSRPCSPMPSSASLYWIRSRPRLGSAAASSAAAG